MATVEYRQASRIYDPARPAAVNRLSLQIADGEFLVLVGPSGSGKSTAMRMLAGLEQVDEGAIFIDGEDVTETRARDRDVAMVFQSYALYPNMTARQNMAFALENLKMDKQEIQRRVDDAAAMLELEDLMDKKPSAMSGGQRQRVAMGRSIVRQPRVWCMDEPLSNLDAKLRVSTRAQIAALQRRLGVTTAYVTHDQTEAMTMGDRVAVLKDGVLQQVDEPTHMYEQPGNTFVAGFIGSPAITLLDGVQLADGRAVLGDGAGFDLGMPAQYAGRVQGEQVIVGVRPEHWRVVGIDGEAPTDTAVVSLEVQLVEKLGAEAFAYGTPQFPEGSPLSARGGRVAVRLEDPTGIDVGTRLHVQPVAGAVSFFDPETEINLAYMG